MIIQAINLILGISPTAASGDAVGPPINNIYNFQDGGAYTFQDGGVYDFN